MRFDDFKELEMQETTERTLTEQRLKYLGTVFADCLKEAYKDSLPKAKFTVYVKSPKYDDQGNESSVLRYDFSDDTVDYEMLKNLRDRQHEPLRQCLLNKISPNQNREPGSNQVEYFGKPLRIEDPPISESDEELTESLSLDESQWIEVIKFAQRRNWFSKIEIIEGAVIGSIVEIPVQEIWGLLKAYLSERNESGDDTLSKLMEKIKDLPLEDILEEIRRNFPGLLL